MKKLLAFASLLLAVTAVYGYTEWHAFPLTAVLHGGSADTTDLGTYLFGASFARFTFHGDTIVDTVSYYQADFQFKPVKGCTCWSASVALGADSITMNSEGTTTMVTDTIAMGGVNTFYQRYGSMQYARVILTPTVLVAKQGLKNCTLYVTKQVDN